MEYDTLLVLCAFGGAAVGTLIDRILGGVSATILSMLVGVVVYALVRANGVVCVDGRICVRTS